MSGELFRLGVREAARRIREGSLTSETYTAALLERVAAADALVGAWAFLAPGLALERARAADRASREGKSLAGIPVGVKDIIATSDMPTEMGSPAFAGNRPERNARVVERVEAAGAFALGKTVTAELAFMEPGKTRNPWNPAHTPGGSSMGSAAAVAAGFVPAALGTQTNGSVIRPAAFCGVVGYKPSRGLLSFDGVARFSPTLDQMGVFTRSAADAAWFASALSEQPGAIVAEPLPLARPPRLALLAELSWAHPDPEQAALLERCAEVFEREGSKVARFGLPDAFYKANRIHRTIMMREAARELGPLQDRGRERLSEVLNAALDEGRAIDEAAYRAALSERHLLMFRLASLIQEFDAVLTPPAPGAAPADLTRTGDPSFCTLWSLTGFPAVTLPAGLAKSGLPLGLQFAAPAGADSRLMASAIWCEGQLAFRQLVDRETSVGSR